VPMRPNGEARRPPMSDLRDKARAVGATRLCLQCVCCEVEVDGANGGIYLGCKWGGFSQESLPDGDIYAHELLSMLQRAVTCEEFEEAKGCEDRVPCDAGCSSAMDELGLDRGDVCLCDEPPDGARPSDCTAPLCAALEKDEGE